MTNVLSNTLVRSEQDLRLRLLNTLLTTPHRKLEEIWPVHREMVSQDPRFYVQLAAWYFDHGDVRDHKEMFAVTLILSDFPRHRDVGLAMVRMLPPYQVGRVLDFIHGRKTTRKSHLKVVNVERHVTESFGLFRNPPRSLRTEISRYLREREADAQWFDATVLTARKAVKRLYALNHIKPGQRAQRILFEQDPPRDSRIFALRELAKATSPAEQARAIVENAIPYRVASTVIRQMTPAVLLALVQQMTPQELINNIASLTKRGAMDNAEIKALIEEKLKQAQSAPRVSAFKATTALEALSGMVASATMTQQLEQVADQQLKSKGRIKRPTALLIDKSGSMQLTIELGKRIGAMISAVCDADLFVYAFDTMAYPIDRPFDAAQGRPADDLASWERALAGINASGGTSCGVALETMRLNRQYVEQIILVTDEGENTAPLFVPTLAKYRSELNADPSVCIVRVPRSTNAIETQCRKAGVTCDVFEFGGDYYALPNLVPLLSRPSKLELLIEIMSYPLPVRKSA